VDLVAGRGPAEFAQQTGGKVSWLMADRSSQAGTLTHAVLASLSCTDELAGVDENPFGLLESLAVFGAAMANATEDRY